jgi:hypothetical protein
MRTERHPATPHDMGCSVFANRFRLFSRSLNLIVDDLPRFREGLFGSGERRCRCEPEPVLVVYRGNETGLARQLEPVEMVGLGLKDHGPRPHADQKPTSSDRTRLVVAPLRPA